VGTRSRLEVEGGVGGGEVLEVDEGLSWLHLVQQGNSPAQAVAKEDLSKALAHTAPGFPPAAFSDWGALFPGSRGPQPKFGFPTKQDPRHPRRFRADQGGMGPGQGSMTWSVGKKAVSPRPSEKA